MEDVSNYLLVEKYRPRKIDDLIMSEERKSFLNNFIKNKTIPNLLFYGGAGGGKTTVSRILIDNIIENDENLLILNGTQHYSVDVVRTQIASFLSIPVESPDNIKIVYIDEACNISTEAQRALLHIIENYQNNNRFILTLNRLYKIDKGLQSRFSSLEFNILDKNNIHSVLKDILIKENIKYNDETLENIIDIHYPDVRKMINTIEISVKDNELIDNTYNNPDKILISMFIDFVYMVSNNKSKEKIDRQGKDISEFIGKSVINYEFIYESIFNSNIPFWAKFVIGKSSNKLDMAISPQINFMTCVWGIYINGNKYKDIVEKNG